MVYSVLIFAAHPDDEVLGCADTIARHHRRLHEAVVTACRPTLGQQVLRLLIFEVASSTEWHLPGSAPAFQPNWFVDICAQLPRNREALVAYASEMFPWPHARSIEAVEFLAPWRGVQVGVEASEAICLLQEHR